MMCSSAFLNLHVFSNNYSELVLSLKYGHIVVEATEDLLEKKKKRQVSFLGHERDLSPKVDLLK